MNWVDLGRGGWRGGVGGMELGSGGDVDRVIFGEEVGAFGMG